MNGVDIRSLRGPPELPDEYFAIVEYLDPIVGTQPIVSRPHNLATLAAILAVEQLNHELHPLALKEIHLLRMLGRSAAVTTYSIAMGGVFRGLQILLRAIDRSQVADSENEQCTDELIQEARKSLFTVNQEVLESSAMMSDVAIGWRTFHADGKAITTRSLSPERFARGIALPLQREHELNVAYLKASAKDVGLQYAMNELAAGLSPDFEFEPNEEMIDVAEEGARRAGDMLSEWSIPPEYQVAGRFTVGEFRAASEAVHAYSGLLERFNSARAPRPKPRFVVKTIDEWVVLIQRRTQYPVDHAIAVLEFMTRKRSDLWDQGRASPAATHTPFTGLRNERLALMPTLAIWRDPQLALRSIWKVRAPANYNATVASLNHGLSDYAHSLFQTKGWPSVLRRAVPGGGDIDAGTGSDEIFVCGECKVFIDDPVRGADEPTVWRDLERNVAAMQREETQHVVSSPMKA